MTWTISQSAMMVPFLVSIILWKERVGIHQWVGLFVLVSAMWFLAAQHAGASPGKPANIGAWAATTTLCFLLCGISQILVLIPSHWRGWQDNAALRVPLVNASAAVAFGVLSIVLRKPLTKKCLKLGVPLGVCYVLGGRSLFAAADALTASGFSALTYPIAIGGSVLGFAGYSRFFLREPFSKWQWAGIFLGVGGIALLACTV